MLRKRVFYLNLFKVFAVLVCSKAFCFLQGYKCDELMNLTTLKSFQNSNIVVCFICVGFLKYQ